MSASKQAETAIMNRIRLRIAKWCTTFRNDNGHAIMPNGSRITYGLGKGTSDIIGYTPVTITHKMIGRKFAVFTAIEVKQPGKYATKDQKNFVNQVASSGGIGVIATSEEDAVNGIQFFVDNTV